MLLCVVRKTKRKEIATIITVWPSVRGARWFRFFSSRYSLLARRRSIKEK
jgi:hypothetical protein